MLEFDYLALGRIRIEGIVKRIKLFSRKNEVYHVVDGEKSYIEKIFVDSSRFENEVKTFERIKQISYNLPQRYEVDFLKQVVRYEYIEGELLSAILANGCVECFAAMGNYLSHFHKIFASGGETILAGDVNLRNFKYFNGRIVALDYEEYRKGQAHEDVTTFLSHLVSHREVEERIRVNMGRVFLESYYKNGEEFNQDHKLNYMDLETEIKRKAQRLADFRGFGDLEDEVIGVINKITVVEA